MFQFRYLLVFLLIFAQCKDKEQHNENLKAQLENILEIDQDLRVLFDNHADSLQKAQILTKYDISTEEFKRKGWLIVQEQDEKNLKEIEAILADYGYPSPKEVGQEAADAVWFVIQHSDKIEKYFPLIQKAGNEDKIDKTLVAMMQDRLLMQKDKPQIYGTQISSTSYEDAFGNKQWNSFVWPIENPEKVNALRVEIGFEETIEEYAAYFDIAYKVYTMEDFVELRKN